MLRILGTALLAAACGLLALDVRADDDPPPAKKGDKKPDPKKPEAPKKEEAKDADKEPPAYNAPPKGQAVLPVGTFKGKITRASDGKVFGFQADTLKKDVEINLAATTRVQAYKKDEFDEKGNPKKNPHRGPVKATADDIKSGAAIVELSGTRKGDWYVARRVILLGEGD